MKFKDFIGKKGKYPLQLEKMLTHKYHVILLGKKNRSDRRETYVRSRDGRAIKIERDFAEKFSVLANKQMQFEYFYKEVSLGMEGVTVYLLPPGASEYETRFYSILSTEKTQDGRIMYTNTEMILKDLQKQLASGIEILLIEEILDGSDGCSEQYQCGTALYMLWKFSRGRDIIYDRAIDSPGHGKKQIDGYSGDDKKHLENEYTFNVES